MDNILYVQVIYFGYIVFCDQYMCYINCDEYFYNFFRDVVLNMYKIWSLLMMMIILMSIFDGLLFIGDGGGDNGDGEGGNGEEVVFISLIVGVVE